MAAKVRRASTTGRQASCTNSREHPSELATWGPKQITSNRAFISFALLKCRLSLALSARASTSTPRQRFGQRCRRALCPRTCEAKPRSPTIAEYAPRFHRSARAPNRRAVRHSRPRSGSRLRNGSTVRVNNAGRTSARPGGSGTVGSPSIQSAYFTTGHPR